MATHTFDLSNLTQLYKIVPLSALVIEWSDDTYRFELVESDSTLSIQGIGEATDRGIDRMTAVIVTSTLVIMHNAYDDEHLRTAMRRMARESDSVVNLTIEAKPLPGQRNGATLDISPETGEITVADLGIDPWSVEWIPTERPRLSIKVTMICSIDVLDDWLVDDEPFSKLFHHIEGYD